MTTKPPSLIGHGYDLHRLEPPPCGRPMILGGVPVDCDRGPVSHSDGDALRHAVTDAILGALGQPDIGELFPDDEPANESADSLRFLEEAARRMRDAGYAISNLDATVISERPKLRPLKQRIITQLARDLRCDQQVVNVKGKSHEGVDAVGEGRAIEVHVVVLLTRIG